MKRNVLFASWALAAVAGTLWACSASITPPDLSADGGEGTGDDASLNGDDGGSTPSDDSGGGGDDSAITHEAGGDGGGDGGGEIAVCGATATYDLCTACCDSYHPGGSDVIPNTAYDCVCIKGPGLNAHECATKCAASYCNDAGITAPAPGSACETCLNAALAGDAGDASAPSSPGHPLSRPGDCLGPALAACTASPACVGYQKCYAAANCDPKP